MLVGGEPINAHNTQSSYKTDVISLEFDLNISRLDLVGGNDKGSVGDTILKRDII